MKWFVEFFFTNAWHFVGLVVVIYVTGETLADVLRALRGPRPAARVPDPRTPAKAQLTESANV